MEFESIKKIEKSVIGLEAWPVKEARNLQDTF